MNGAPPLISDVSRPWWDALARHTIAMQQCRSCDAWVFYPRPFCTSCGSHELEWRQVEPRAMLFTYTIAHHAVAPAFAHLSRPILAIAELTNGVRVPTTIEADAARDLNIGMALTPHFDDLTYAGVTLLRFVPSTSA